MQQRVYHGAMIDAVTPDEMVKMFLTDRRSRWERVRAPASLPLNASGAGGGDIYKCPTGMEFAARRVVFTLTGTVPSDPNTGNVLLTAAGKYIAYMRGGYQGELIEYAQPQYGAAVQVPGVQTWGEQQGPYIRNGEVFAVLVAGLTANLVLNVYLEGLLRPYHPDTEK